MCDKIIKPEVYGLINKKGEISKLALCIILLVKNKQSKTKMYVPSLIRYLQL